MSFVVRLQGLPDAADSLDIRRFFSGLNIPRRGVCIMGGKYGEAYIIFETYEHAQYALNLSGRPLKESYVHLRYSNEEEMRRALEIYQMGPRLSVGTSNTSEKKKPSGFSYLYVCGLSSDATRRDIWDFFKGFLMEAILYIECRNNPKLRKAIVKFGKVSDASEAAKMNMQPLCYCPVMLKVSNEEEWTFHGGDKVARRLRSSSRSRSPLPRRSSSESSPYIRDFYVHLINLSYKAEKSDIRHFFYGCDMKDSDITFLVDKEGKRTREGFVLFTTETDYRRAVSMDGGTLKGHSISVMPIPKKAMSELISRMKVRTCKDCSEKSVSPHRPSEERKCLYLRNFPSDVAKADIQKFFTGQPVKEEDIVLLRDSRGVGLGEALVTFADEREASNAERLNDQTYLGLKIVVSRITEKQLTPLKEANQAEIAIVSEADDAPDGVGTDGDSAAATTSNDSQAVQRAVTESALPSGWHHVPVTPLIQNIPKSVNGCHEEPACQGDKTENGDATVLFLRNLPVSVTAAEILDFFHDYKVSSVNLRNIEQGVATVRMPNQAEAESAIKALNNHELCQKQVSLTLT
ncbi:RNA-binding protein 12B-like [Bufo gargarizans]|uniref:RNA-binding protein 12B-like n=1 Tax=Bufo gargarizans TaxID=30331 RepID=UPI001CF4BE6A|nr:RNA-binding protein 12B-like [Bufo gargarizans]